MLARSCARSLIRSSKLVARQNQVPLVRFFATKKETPPPPPPPSKSVPKPPAPDPAASASASAGNSPLTGVKGKVLEVSEVYTDSQEYAIARAAVLPRKLYSRSGIFVSDRFAEVYIGAILRARGEPLELPETDEEPNQKLPTLAELRSTQYAQIGIAAVQQLDYALQNIDDAFYENPELEEYLNETTATPEDKEKLVDGLCEKLHVVPAAAEFVHQLIGSRLFHQFGLVITEFQGLVKATEETVDITVTLASESQPKPKLETVRRLLDIPDKCPVSVDYRYDASIIGGAVFQTEGAVLDLSHQDPIFDLDETLDAALRKSIERERNEFLQELREAERKELASQTI